MSRRRSPAPATTRAQRPAREGAGPTQPHGETAPWRCYAPLCRDGSRWWMTRFCVVLCRNCHPPAPGDVIVAQGGVEDAPRVYVHWTTTPVPGTVPGNAGAEL